MEVFSRNQLQRIGESMVASLLREAGCTLIQRNFRALHAEIDLIFRYKTTLLIVEVRTIQSEQMPDISVVFPQSKLHKVSKSTAILRRSRKEFEKLQFRILYYLVLFNKKKKMFSIIRIPRHYFNAMV